MVSEYSTVILILVCNPNAMNTPLIILPTYVDSWYFLNGFTNITVKKSAQHGTKDINCNHYICKLQLAPNCWLFFWYRGTKLQRRMYRKLLQITDVHKLFRMLTKDHLNFHGHHIRCIGHEWDCNKDNMWPNLRKPDIMAHTKIFSIKHYKNLVQKRIS